MPRRRTSVKTNFPLIRAIVYFNANQDYDWRMDTVTDAYQAFKNLANDPFFGHRTAVTAG